MDDFAPVGFFEHFSLRQISFTQVVEHLRNCYIVFELHCYCVTNAIQFTNQFYGNTQRIYCILKFTHCIHGFLIVFSHFFLSAEPLRISCTKAGHGIAK